MKLLMCNQPGKNASKKRIEQFNRGVWECNSCHMELSFDKFCKINRHWSGLDYKCRACSTSRRTNWRDNNKFKNRANDMNRRAEITYISAQNLIDIYNSGSQKCFYCGIPVDVEDKGSLHFDHVIPNLNKITNIVLSCFRCNTLKSDGTIHDFQNFVNKINEHSGTEHEVAFV